MVFVKLLANAIGLTFIVFGLSLVGIVIHFLVTAVVDKLYRRGYAVGNAVERLKLYVVIAVVALAWYVAYAAHLAHEETRDAAGAFVFAVYLTAVVGVLLAVAVLDAIYRRFLKSYGSIRPSLAIAAAALAFFVLLIALPHLATPMGSRWERAVLLVMQALAEGDG